MVRCPAPWSASSAPNGGGADAQIIENTSTFESLLPRLPAVWYGPPTYATIPLVIAHESNGRRRRVLSASTTAIVVAIAALGVFAAPAKHVKTLPGPDSSNFYPFDQINKSNVGQLEVAWFYPYAAPTFNPIVVDDVLYGLGRNGPRSSRSTPRPARKSGSTRA